MEHHPVLKQLKVCPPPPPVTRCFRNPLNTTVNLAISGDSLCIDIFQHISANKTVMACHGPEQIYMILKKGLKLPQLVGYLPWKHMIYESHYYPSVYRIIYIYVNHKLYTVMALYESYNHIKPSNITHQPPWGRLASPHGVTLHRSEAKNRCEQGEKRWGNSPLTNDQMMSKWWWIHWQWNDKWWMINLFDDLLLHGYVK